MTRAEAEMKALERYPHEGSGHLRAAFMECYEWMTNEKSVLLDKMCMPIPELEAARKDTIEELRGLTIQLAMLHAELYRRGCMQYSGFEVVPGYARRWIELEEKDGRA